MPRLAALSLCLAAAFAADARAADAPSAPDWNAAAAVRTVEVVTTNPDGSPKETTVWLAVVDGQGYIRTSNTRWWKNIERDPNVVLRIEAREYPLRVELATDPAERARIEAAFREKYGFTDRLLDWFRSAEPHLMRLVPRGALPPTA